MSSHDEITDMSHRSPFEAIRRETEDGNKYWSARDLSKLLGYAKWDKFKIAIERAKKACENSKQAVSGHFLQSGKLISAGKGAQRTIEDYHLSRYACYLLVENADPSKPIVALGQAYFAIQTRRQELADQLTELPEDQLRLIRRSQMSVLNNQLAEAAQGAGVIQPVDFAIFQDHGYMGLYGGLKAKDIHGRKDLKPDQEILDWMDSDELAANAFRASLAKQKIEREQVKGKERANQAHHEMGKLVRKTIEQAGATLPEDMPTPEKSIQQLQSEEKKQLQQRSQPSLFDETENKLE